MLGGLLLCIGGTNLDQYAVPTVMLGTAPCNAGNTTLSTTQLCCTTSAAVAVASVAVSVHVIEIGFAIATDSMQSFSYVQALDVKAITPATGHADSTLTLTMDELPFGTMPRVMLGGYACGSVQVAAASNSQSQVTCVASSAPPGVVPVSVHVPSLGFAGVATELTFEYVIAIAAVSPAAGSAGGGTLLTVSGHGFEYIQATDASSLVTVGDQSCTVVSHTPTEITCYAPAVVDITDNLEDWVHGFYPQPPASPPPSAPPLPVRA